MTWRNTIVFFVLSYLIGWGLYPINFYNKDLTIYYVMGLFVLINIFTIFHPLIFHYGIMRPFQLSLASVGVMSILDGEMPMFMFTMLLVLSLMFLEREDIYTPVVSKEKGNRLFLTVKRLLVSILLPFSVVYSVLILRPYESISSLLVVMVYFSVLFVFSKWFNTIISFSLFTIIQMILLVFVLESYFVWSSVQITIFFISIFLFLLTGYGRKGLLTYARNNK